MSTLDLDGIHLEAIRAAHEASRTIAVRTPILSAWSISEAIGGEVVLKAENLQRTGSFKLRGALNKVRTLPAGCPGVVAGSAGNHAQGVAYAARARGVPATIFMPIGAPVSKIAAVRELGAEVRLEDPSVEACLASARAMADADGAVFLHPFDDAEVVNGQGGVGLELLEDVAGLRQVVVPIGGGGLASGVAVALKAHDPTIRVVGVQAAACAAFADAFLQGEPATIDGQPTIADGIAVKRPGGITFALLERHLDDLVTVDEDEIAEAMVLLMERGKLVVEGAGAVGAAAMIAGRVAPDPRGPTALVLSGGNVDVSLMAALTRRHETRVGRRMRLLTRIADRPGGLAALLGKVADAGVNLLEVAHVRDGLELDVRETALELTVETSGPADAERLLAALTAAGYEVSDVARSREGG